MGIITGVYCSWGPGKTPTFGSQYAIHGKLLLHTHKEAYIYTRELATRREFRQESSQTLTVSRR